jgi:hypothetical protein
MAFAGIPPAPLSSRGVGLGGSLSQLSLSDVGEAASQLQVRMGSIAVAGTG